MPRSMTKLVVENGELNIGNGESRLYPGKSEGHRLRYIERQTLRQRETDRLTD